MAFSRDNISALIKLEEVEQQQDSLGVARSSLFEIIPSLCRLKTIVSGQNRVLTLTFCHELIEEKFFFIRNSLWNLSKNMHVYRYAGKSVLQGNNDC